MGRQVPVRKNPRLRLERVARGWEQDDVVAGLEELAVLLGEATPGVDANLVSKWERGVRTPGPYYKPRLCLLFQLPPEELGFLPGPRLCSECRRLSDVLGRALARTLGDVRRREFLHTLLWGGAALAAGSTVDAERMIAAASGQVDRRFVDDLHTVADDYARQMHTTAPRDLLPQVERHLAHTQSILRGPRPSAEETHLHLVAAILAAVAGRLSFSLGNPGDAWVHQVAAEIHANQAGDGPLRAYVLGQRSWLCSDLVLRGKFPRSSNFNGRRDWHGTGAPMSLQLLDKAHAAVPGSSSPWLRMWLSAERAEEHAARGDARAALHDLEEADRSLGAATSTDDAFFANFHDSPAALLAGYRGNCMQLLGRTAEAATIIEGALAGLSPSLVSARCFVLVDLATAYAKEEDVERACGVLSDSLDLGSDRGLVAHIQRVVGVRQHLTRWDDASAVRHLDERLHALTWPPA